LNFVAEKNNKKLKSF